ncbi:MAG: hypothetical protein ACFCUI_11230 [Bernardetiaceae bacterium]
MIISEKNFQQIHVYLMQAGVSQRSLREELSDHLACLTEDVMRTEGMLFEDAFAEARRRVCPQGPQQIQRDLFFSQLKQYVQMRKFQFLIGYLSTMFFLVGYSFKVMHFPGANLQIMIGLLVFALAFLPSYWLNRLHLDRLKGKARPLYFYLLNLAFSIIPVMGTGMLFMKWPGAKAVFIVGQLILAFYFMPRLFRQLYDQHLKVVSSLRDN